MDKVIIDSITMYSSGRTGNSLNVSDLHFLANPLHHASSLPFSQRKSSQTGKLLYGRSSSKPDVGSTPDVPLGYCFNYHNPGRFCSIERLHVQTSMPNLGIDAQTSMPNHTKYKHNKRQANSLPQGTRSTARSL